MKFITPDEIEWFRQHYKNANPDAMLEYALKCADEYAELHARDALPSIKNAIAQLHFRYVLQGDPGERTLIRVAIDQLIDLGRGINANSAKS